MSIPQHSNQLNEHSSTTHRIDQGCNNPSTQRIRRKKMTRKRRSDVLMTVTLAVTIVSSLFIMASATTKHISLSSTSSLCKRSAWVVPSPPRSTLTQPKKRHDYNIIMPHSLSSQYSSIPCIHHLKTPHIKSTTTSLLSSFPKNDVHPYTKPLSKSLYYFFQYALIQLKYNKKSVIKKRETRFKLRQKFKLALKHRTAWRNKWASSKKLDNDDDEEEENQMDEFKIAQEEKAALNMVITTQDDDDDASVVLQDDDEEEEPKNIKKTLTKLYISLQNLISLVGYDASFLIPSFGFLIAASFMSSIVPHYMGECVSCVIQSCSSGGGGGSCKKVLMKALFGLGMAKILEAAFAGARGALFWIAGSRGNYNVRVKLHHNLLLQEAAFFDSTETGILLSRINNDVNKIGQVISFHINIVFRQLTQFVFGSFFLLKISPQMSLVAFTGIGFIAIISAIYGQFSRVLAEKVQDKFAEASAIAETSFRMSETIRAFNGINLETSKYEAGQGEALELEEVQAWAYGMHKFIADSVETLLHITVMYCCWSVGRLHPTLVDGKTLTSFLFYVKFVLESSNEVGNEWAKIQSAIGASSKIFELIGRVPRINDQDVVVVDKEEDDLTMNATSTATSTMKEVKEEEKEKQQPIINMSNMTVTYGAMEAPALKNINLQIHEHDRVAIVGRSGSGKSSMLRTILRFYDPSSGSIELQGINLQDQTRKDISRKVVVVEQEPHLFPTTLMENVLYGLPYDENDVEQEEGMRVRVAEALELAGLPVTGDDKNDLGLELDTRVGEGGRTLSGGQRQRVAIARALIRSPDVLLLDEPTAALDSKSEKTVVDALQRVMQKGARSMVMVTHRLGVIRSVNVNKVIVLEKGEIAEVGHPEELLQNKDGLYSQLAREQGIVAESSSLSSEIMSSHSSATTTTTTLVNGDVNGSVDGGGGRLEHDVEMKDIPTPLAQC
mmetsp:Transcript_26001/g.38676  ORF Transcript_26001/g.38676 Transcript_26001/m.38676 type:complete len:953 (-) Transcript_26001:53-2911(-)